MKETYLVRELADLFHKTKPAINYQMKSMPEAMYEKDEKGVIHVYQSGVRWLCERLNVDYEELENESLKEQAETALAARPEMTMLAGTISVIKGQLEEKDEQIRKLQDQNSRLTELLAEKAALEKKMEEKLQAAPEPERKGFFARLFG